jgi:hypothetical protein
MPPTLAGTPADTIYGDPLSHTVGAGADIVVGGVRLQGTNTISATYGGDAMTDVLAQVDYNFDSRRAAFLYKLAPATGAQNYDVTSAGTIRGTGCASFADVNTTTPWGDTDSANNDASDDPALTLTGTTDDLGLFLIGWSGTGVTLTPAVGEVVFTASEDSHNIALLSMPGATTLAWSGTFSAAVDWCVMGAVLQGVATEDLSVTDQPTTGVSTVTLADIVVESTDTASTATVTAALYSGSGELIGTLTEAMVAGVATFDALKIVGTGAHVIRFSAVDHNPVDSATITIAGPDTQTLRPDGVVSGSGWTANTTTLDGDTSDSSDSTDMHADDEGSVTTLSLDDPSPAFDEIGRISLTIRTGARLY